MRLYLSPNSSDFTFKMCVMVCKLNLNTFDLNTEKTGKSEGMRIGPGVVYANPALLLHIQKGNLSRTQVGK